MGPRMLYTPFDKGPHKIDAIFFEAHTISQC